MSRVAVVSDTSPLNYLILIDAADLLPRLAASVLVPPAVERELSHSLAPAPVRHWIARPPPWLHVIAPRKTIASLGLDAGETEAISLAVERGIRSLLIDERKGFNTAMQLGLEPFGLLAVLEFSAASGWIDFEEYMLRLRGTTFRFQARVVEGIRERLSK